MVERKPSTFGGGTVVIKCKDFAVINLDINSTDDFNNVADSLDDLSNISKRNTKSRLTLAANTAIEILKLISQLYYLFQTFLVFRIHSFTVHYFLPLRMAGLRFQRRQSFQSLF